MSAEKKQEADFSKDVDALIAASHDVTQSGKLAEVMEQAYVLEKKARNAADLTSTTRLLLLILQVLRTTPSPSSPKWDELNEAILSLSRKHGQLKQAITRMVGAAMCYLHPPGIGETGKEEEVQMEYAEEDKRTEKEKAAEAKKAQEEKANREKDPEAKEKDQRKEAMKEAVEAATEDKGEGKENEGVRSMMDKAKEVGNTGVTEEMRMKLVETIRQVTEGKVSACFTFVKVDVAC